MSQKAFCIGLLQSCCHVMVPSFFLLCCAWGSKCSKCFSVTFDVRSHDVSQKRKRRLTLCKVCLQKDKEWKEKFTPFGVNVMRSKVFYQAAQEGMPLVTVVRSYACQVKWCTTPYGYQATQLSGDTLGRSNGIAHCTVLRQYSCQVIQSKVDSVERYGCQVVRLSGNAVVR